MEKLFAKVQSEVTPPNKEPEIWLMGIHKEECCGLIFILFVPPPDQPRSSYLHVPSLSDFQHVLITLSGLMVGGLFLFMLLPPRLHSRWANDHGYLEADWRKTGNATSTDKTGTRRPRRSNASNGGDIKLRSNE